jgi:hypothetical protein
MVHEEYPQIPQLASLLSCVQVISAPCRLHPALFCTTTLTARRCRDEGAVGASAAVLAVVFRQAVVTPTLTVSIYFVIPAPVSLCQHVLMLRRLTLALICRAAVACWRPFRGVHGMGAVFRRQQRGPCRCVGILLDYLRLRPLVAAHLGGAMVGVVAGLLARRRFGPML